MVHTLVLRGPDGTRAAFAQTGARASMPDCRPSTTERFSYAALVAVGETEEEGLRLGEKLLWFLNTSMKSAPQFGKFLPRRRAARCRAHDLSQPPRVSKSAESEKRSGNLKPSLGNAPASWA
jgi:hypothetical protein